MNYVSEHLREAGNSSCGWLMLVDGEVMMKGVGASAVEGELCYVKE